MNEKESTVPMNERFAFYFVLFTVVLGLSCVIWNLWLFACLGWVILIGPLLGGIIAKRVSKATHMSCAGMAASLTVLAAIGLIVILK
jgi:hypothetical protein